eukprot:5459375-Ditylum_brightwellii.AAC.1
MYQNITQQKRPNSKFAKVGPLSDLVQKSSLVQELHVHAQICSTRTMCDIFNEREQSRTYDEEANERKKASFG